MTDRERLIEAGLAELYPLTAQDKVPGHPTRDFLTRFVDALPAAVAVRFFAARLTDEEWEAMAGRAYDRLADGMDGGPYMARIRNYMLLPDEYPGGPDDPQRTEDLAAFQAACADAERKNAEWAAAALRAALVPEGPEGDTDG